MTILFPARTSMNAYELDFVKFLLIIFISQRQNIQGFVINFIFVMKTSIFFLKIA